MSGQLATTEPAQDSRGLTPAALLSQALHSGAGIETMERLMAMQERWEANEARRAYVAAMAAFKADPPTVVKRRHVSFANTEYHHADLAEVCSAAIAGLAKHGLSHRWEVKQEDKTIAVSCVVTHQLGHAESVTISAAPDQSGGKNAIQAIASTVTYLERYTLLAITGLAAKDMDDDGRTAEEPQWLTDWREKIQQADTLEDLHAVGQEMHAGCNSKQKDRLRPIYAARKKELGGAA